MDILNVETKSKDYKIYIDESFCNIREVINNINFKNILIITDNNVEKLYLKNLKNNLKGYEIFQYIINSGEISKNLNTINDIYDFAIDCNVNKSTLVIALGGGVVGDITGFFSSTYYRGLKFIQIPTTLLSQVDSSVGGKTGVDFCGFKNIIGSIYQPEAVFVNINTVLTLTNKEFANGMAEVIKYGVAFDYDFFEFIEFNKYHIKNREKFYLSHIIKNSIKIKKDIVSKDELDEGVRRKLNLGHTFGHSIEKSTDFLYSHGEAIAIGTMMSLILSKNKKLINNNEINRIEKLYNFFELPLKLFNVDKELVYKNMLNDKKMIGDKLNLCIIDSLGSCIIISEFCKEDIILAINSQIGEV